MKILTLKRLGAVLSLGVLLMPLTSFAATTRAVAEPISGGVGDGTIGICADYFDGTVQTDVRCLNFNMSTATSAQSLIDAGNAAITSYATMNGWTLSNGILWEFLSPNQVNSLIASATSSLATVASTGSYTDLSNKPTIPTQNAMSFANPTRSLNSAFQVSSTSAAFVSYSVDVASTLSLTSGQTGTVTLQYADDSGFTSNVKTVQSSVNGNTGSLTIGLNLTQTATAAVTGMIPAGKYVKIVTANTAGTPTFTFRAAQEVLLPSN